ncbi:MAG: phosphoribosylaminoimidazolesuccinocarboxamide synthase [Terriglobales bacterium]
MSNASSTLWQSQLTDLPLISRGKVRDLYDAGDALLMVASDRLSAFDVVLPTPIPDKGRVLTQISLFWFEFLRPTVQNHLLSARVEEFPAAARSDAAQLRGRAMLTRKLEMAPIECVVRGYLSGSGWKEYKKSGTVCGIALPAGLQESSRLPEPIFTPSTKAQTGHDENINFDQAAQLVGRRTAERLRDLSVEVYRRAAAYAEGRGIILADTKFEFGRLPGAGESGELILADEVLTPDSSRFWPREQYQPGRAQDSYDKQYVRDYLEQIRWNKQAPGPELPAEVVARTTEKYREAYRQLTGKPLPEE